MLRKVVTYIDFDGNEQSETLYFNLNEVEGARLEVKFPGGVMEYVNQFNPQERPDEILDFFELVLSMSYGVKSEDGRHFLKTKEKTELFKQSAAYSALFMELMTDAEVAASFFEKVVFANAKKPAEESN